MPKSYDVDLRKNVIGRHLIELGIKPHLVAWINKIDKRTVTEWHNRYICHRNILSHSEIFGDNRGRPSTVTLCVV